jgi:large subunit ribosomal protein L13
MKTFALKKEEVQREWFVIDVTDKVLGRVATKIADRIRGKDKPTFTPHTDGGDYVVVINAKKLKLQALNLKIKNTIPILYTLGD